MSWFLEGLKLDLEVLSRSLAQSQCATGAAASRRAGTKQRSRPNDLAA